jgi:hypothetical protein
MEIDIASRVVGIGSFIPSKVDLTKVKNSFILVATFSTKTIIIIMKPRLEIAVLVGSSM